jgi:hypothetical protein
MSGQCAEPCDLGVGCEEYGVCYADAHGQPDQCGRNPSPNPRGTEMTDAKPCPTEPCLIWSNEHNAYWRPDSCGYTVRMKSVGIYSRAEAESIVRGTYPEKGLEIEPLTPTPREAAMREALEEIITLAEDEAYKITADQKPCRHIDGLNNIHEAARAALATT